MGNTHQRTPVGTGSSGSGSTARRKANLKRNPTQMTSGTGLAMGSTTCLTGTLTTAKRTRKDRTITPSAESTVSRHDVLKLSTTSWPHDDLRGGLLFKFSDDHTAFLKEPGREQALLFPK